MNCEWGMVNCELFGVTLCIRLWNLWLKNEARLNVVLDKLLKQQLSCLRRQASSGEGYKSFDCS